MAKFDWLESCALVLLGCCKLAVTRPSFRPRTTKGGQASLKTIPRILEAPQNTMSKTVKDLTAGTAGGICQVNRFPNDRVDESRC